MKNTTLFSLILTGISASVIAASAPANAATFGFNNITGGDTVGDAYNGGFSFDLTNNNDGTVLFKFKNTTSGSAALKQVAFSVDSTVSGLLSNMVLDFGNVGTVDFKTSSTNLSQSNKITGWDGETFGAVTNGANSNAVQAGEALGIKFTGNYNNILSALNTGKLLVGIHVGSLPNGGASDSYVNSVGNPNTTAVPEPATFLGAGLAFGAATVFRRKNQQKSFQVKA